MQDTKRNTVATTALDVTIGEVADVNKCLLIIQAGYGSNLLCTRK